MSIGILTPRLPPALNGIQLLPEMAKTANLGIDEPDASGTSAKTLHHRMEIAMIARYDRWELHSSISRDGLVFLFYFIYNCIDHLKTSQTLIN